MKAKNNAGRKPLDDNKKKVPVTIWVRREHSAYAKQQCLKVQIECDKKN
jgi:hypothetical protein